MLAQSLADAFNHGLTEVLRRGQHFGDADAPAGFLDHGHVGECATDVDTDPPGHAVTPSRGPVDRTGSLNMRGRPTASHGHWTVR